MFGTLGMPELLFILVLALLVFGPKRLPQVGKTLGKGLREFRRATNELRRTVNTEISATDSEPTRPTPAAPPQYSSSRIRPQPSSRKPRPRRSYRWSQKPRREPLPPPRATGRKPQTPLTRSNRLGRAAAARTLGRAGRPAAHDA
ncbi:MAG: twin-arginine translocase TatA/TatE family subunit, partial [Acidobacteria bacterium]|nr:twin-arginine translocase TatA/TatE family subunit [Acidobacteriota bacterium]